MHTTPTNLLNRFLINSVKSLLLRRHLCILELGTHLFVSSHTPIGVVIFNIIQNGCVGFSVSYSSFKMAELAPLCQFQHHNPIGCRKVWTSSALSKVLYRVTHNFQPFLRYRVVFNLTPTVLYFHYRRSNLPTRLSFCPDNIYFSGGLLPEIIWLVFLRP